MAQNFRNGAQSFQNARQQFPNDKRYGVQNPSVAVPRFGSSGPSFSSLQQGRSQGRRPHQPQQIHQKINVELNKGSLRSSSGLSQHASGHNVRYTMNLNVNTSGNDRYFYGRLHQTQQNFDLEDRRPDSKKPGLLRAPVAETESSVHSPGSRGQMFHYQECGQEMETGQASKRGYWGISLVSNVGC